MKRDADLILRSLLLALIVLGGNVAAEPYRWTGVERVIVFTDAHGAYPALVQMLKKTQVIDENLEWSAGASHLVSLGDNVDRGPESRRILDLLMRLQTEARAAGGMVHVLNGNHEVMNLTGELSYVAPEEFAAFASKPAASTGSPDEPEAGDAGPAPAKPATSEPATALPPGFLAHREAFSLDGHYGAWLAERPLAIVINDSAFIHGGLSEELDGMDLQEINRDAGDTLRRYMRSYDALMAAGVITHADHFRAVQEKARLAADDDTLADTTRDAAKTLRKAVQGLPFAPHGPVWYRRTAMCHPFNEYPVTLDILEELDAKRVFVGHTVTHNHRVGERLNGRVYRLDTGMLTSYYRGIPAMTVIEGDTVTVHYADREGPSAPHQEANRQWLRPYGMSDAEMEEFLRTAPVVLDEELDLGVTRPHRITLERDGRRMRAVFKTEDTHKGLERGRWKRSGENSDRYVYDVAAYKLDRYLGLEMVPPAVIRQHQGKTGVAQYWVENAINERSRRENEIPYVGYCDPNAQWRLMDAFDILIHNEDRNQGNILWDRNEWFLWLIDHSRAFRTTRQHPDYLKNVKVIPNDWLAASLQRVTTDNLEFLGDYLNRSQIKALELRAEKLLKNR